MNIGIDIDDTISNTFEYTYPLSREYTRKICKREPKRIEDLSVINHHYVDAINEWNEDEANAFWDKNYIKIVQNVIIKENVKNILDKLRNEGHRIFFITARWDSPIFDIITETKTWLRKNQIEYDDLIVNAENKDVIAKERNIDVFIDDSLENCIAVSKKGIKTFLVDSIPNKNVESPEITRVFSWNEIYEKINSYKKERNEI